MAATARFTTNGVPEIARTPGYPILLLPGIVLGNIDFVTIALQIALSSLSVYLVFKVALLLFENTRIATLCALLYAVEPLSILYTARILSETLFTTLIILLLYCMVRYFLTYSIPFLLASAFVLAGLAYVRPIAYYLPVLMAVILLIWVFARKRKLDQVVAIGAFFLISMGLIGLWQVRNTNEADYRGFAAAMDYNWYYLNGGAVLAEKAGVARAQADQEQYFKDHPEQRTWTQGRMFEAMGKEGRDIVLQNLPIYLVIHLKGTFRMLTSSGGSGLVQTLAPSPQTKQELAGATDRGLAALLTALARINPLLLVVFSLSSLLLVGQLTRM